MPIRVLLMACDDRERRRMLDALEDAGFAVRTAADPEATMAGLADRRADVALLDLSSPELDAMDLLWRIATLERPIPVVISHGPRGWGHRLTSWRVRGFRHDTRATREMMDGVSTAIRSGPGASLPPGA